MEKYSIKEKYKGNVVCTIPPVYKRKEGGRFVLDENLNQKDMGYLFEVIGHDAIVKNEQKESK